MNENGSGRTFLITGATGNIGGRVVDRLLARNERVRVFVRDADRARRRHGDRVDVCVGDLGDADTFSRAVEGVDVAFLVTSGPGLAETDKRAASIAKAAGVGTLVKLSTEDVRHGVGTGVWHREGEAAIRHSGIDFVFVQPSGFMDNFRNWAATIRSDGVARCASGAGAIPFIHSDDIADVSVAALTSARYVGQSLPITGPVALSFADMTAKVGTAIGRQLRFESQSDDEERRQQASWGAPTPLIDARLSIFRAIREGRLAVVTDTVATVLGRQPISFDQWAEQNAVVFR